MTRKPLHPGRAAIRTSLGVFCVLVLSVGGCTNGDPTSPGDASKGAKTSSATPASPPVTTPKLPAAISAAGAPSVPLSKVQTARLKLDSPDWMEVANGALWVKLDGGTIVRVDPETARVEGRIDSQGPDQSELCQGFGTSGDSVWTCTPFGSIERIDASTNRVTARLLIPMRRDQGHMVVASGRIWIGTKSGDSIAGIDLEDNELGEEIQLDAFCTDFAAADPMVWAVCPAENQVVRVDTSTGRVTGRLALTEPRGVTLGDGVWVAFREGLAHVDPDSLSVDAVYEVCPGRAGGMWAGDRVWVRCDRELFLVGVDPVARRVFASVTADDLASSGNVVEIGNQLWATAYDDATVVRLRPPTG